MLDKEVKEWIIICFFVGAACSYAFSNFIEFEIGPVVHPIIISENTVPYRKIKRLNLQEILKKNIFNAKIIEDKPKDTIAKKVFEKAVTEIEGYKLIGFVAGENPLALFKKQQESVCIVDRKNPLAKKWFLERIDHDTVFLKNKDTGEIKKFKIILFKNVNKESFSKIKPIKEANLSENGVSSSIEKFKIDRKTLDRELSDVNKFIKQIGITPYFKKNKAIGYRIVYMNRRSILQKIGLKRGDIIVKINGVATNNPTKIAEMFAQLKEVENVTLDIIRKGEKKTIFIEIE